MSIPAFYSGTGRRKTAIARVRLLPGEGEIVVNGRSLDEHFGNAVNEAEVRMPFRVTGTEGRFNAMIKVEGGGVTGQAGAIRHGIARALLEVDADAQSTAASPGRTADPRSADEGTQEVRAQAGPQGASVHEAINGVGHRHRVRPGWARRRGRRLRAWRGVVDGHGDDRTRSDHLGLLGALTSTVRQHVPRGRRFLPPSTRSY